MKVFFDCIVTHQPERCSTTVQFLTLAERLLELPEMYIYWPIPDRFDEEQLAHYPVHERIRYVPIHQYKDRLKEYNRLSDDLAGLMCFNGDLWDWDVMVTVRSTQVSMLKVLATSPRNSRWDFTKRIVLIEEMMILSKKPSVAQSNPKIQDRLTVEAYLAADKVLMPAYHQVNWVMQVAQQYFSPSTVMEMRSKVSEVCHLNMPEYALKSKENRYDGKRQLGVAFVGRMDKISSRLRSINKILQDQYIMHAPKIYPFCCTVSSGPKIINKEIIETRRPNREEFHRIAREEMDVAVYFYVDVELNMSMLEPMSMGVPAIVIDAPWSRGAVGDDYPFLVKNTTEAHAWISKFRDNYDATYELYEKWFNEWFLPEYGRRKREDDLYEHLMYECQYRQEDTKKRLHSLEENLTVRLMAEHGGPDFVIFDMIRRLGEMGELSDLPLKLEPKDRETRSLVFSTPWNDLRLGLMLYHGYEDASVVTGHMRKVQ